MIALNELNEAIQECENSERHTYDMCIRLAALYIIREQLYSSDDAAQAKQVRTAESVQYIGDFGDSEFMQSIKGKETEDVLHVIDELMSAIRIVNSRLYDGVMRKLDKI